MALAVGVGSKERGEERPKRSDSRVILCSPPKGEICKAKQAPDGKKKSRPSGWASAGKWGMRVIDISEITQTQLPFISCPR